MWSDIVLAAERQHLARLFLWAALSIVAGTAILAMLAVRHTRSRVLAQFATQMAGWGILLALIGAFEWRGLHLRDVGGAARLERALWFRVGLDAGCVGVGLTLTLAARQFGKHVGAMGAGVGVMVQGLALLLLDLQFAALVSR